MTRPPEHQISEERIDRIWRRTGYSITLLALLSWGIALGTDHFKSSFFWYVLYYIGGLGLIAGPIAILVPSLRDK